MRNIFLGASLEQCGAGPAVVQDLEALGAGQRHGQAAGCGPLDTLQVRAGFTPPQSQQDASPLSRLASPFGGASVPARSSTSASENFSSAFVSLAKPSTFSSRHSTSP